jgi:hypothetical protein
VATTTETVGPPARNRSGHAVRPASDAAISHEGAYALPFVVDPDEACPFKYG